MLLVFRLLDPVADDIGRAMSRAPRDPVPDRAPTGGLMQWLARFVEPTGSQIGALRGAARPELKGR